MSGPTETLFEDVFPLFPAQQVDLANPLVCANYRALGSADRTRELIHIGLARPVVQPAVSVGRYPPGTLLSGDGSFQIVLPDGTGGAQVASDGEDREHSLQCVRVLAPTAQHVDRPCLLACRVGEWCWGHWMLDVLPKIVLAERFAPKRFSYAVPARIIDTADRPSFSPGYATSVLQSLEAYGIGANRLFPIHHHATYRFDALFDITGADGSRMHPGTLAAMRDLPHIREDARPASLTAILRDRPSQRALCNRSTIARHLEDLGARSFDAIALSFADQVRVFMAGGVIVGDLGSNLAGMIYAPAGTGLVTLAPMEWTDTYFPYLFQRLDIVQADIRGPSLADPGRHVQTGDYAVTIASLQAGLEEVAAAMAQPSRSIALGTHHLARRVGRVLADLDFSDASGTKFVLGSGFSNPEPGGIWSIGAECRLNLPAPPMDADGIWLEIAGRVFLHPPFLVAKPLGITVAGRRLVDMHVESETVIQIHVPPDLLQLGATLSVELHHPISCSPQSIGASPDHRELGFWFSRIRLYATA